MVGIVDQDGVLHIWNGLVLVLVGGCRQLLLLFWSCKNSVHVSITFSGGGQLVEAAPMASMASSLQKLCRLLFLTPDLWRPLCPDNTKDRCWRQETTPLFFASPTDGWGFTRSSPIPASVDAASWGQWCDTGLERVGFSCCCCCRYVMWCTGLEGEGPNLFIYYCWLKIIIKLHYITL